MDDFLKDIIDCYNNTKPDKKAKNVSEVIEEIEKIVEE